MPVRRIRLPRPATWDDLEDTPEESFAEIVNGEIVLAPRPGVPHMHTSSRLGVLLGGPFDMGARGMYPWLAKNIARAAAATSPPATRSAVDLTRTPG